MERVLRNRQLDLRVVCENIHDPHNVSAILRTCDAAGVGMVHLLYTHEEFPQLGKKSSASAKKWIDIQRHRSFEELQQALHRDGMTIYATHLGERAISIYDVDWTQPSAIIMGNEHRGVSDEALAIADANVYIPQFGMIESLNVSVATAIILYEA
ncbi:MAG TPA: RNA methyltransferase, partial [Calditrichae bacterium]|nr:RNA methyltransferase [Calditrichia bacterium]